VSISILGIRRLNEGQAVWQGPKTLSSDVNSKEKVMRFMMIVKASRDSEAGIMPTEQMLATMGKFNDELVRAGVMVDGSGLQPSSKGFRVMFSGGKRNIVDGPFTESKELIAGYWIINVKSREEALHWAKKVPAPQERGEGEIEVRQFFELEDFAPSPAIEQHREIARKLAARK
jgi:hypothetical protein